MDDDEDDINKSKITFRTHFVTFVSQAITGVIFPFYKNITDDGTFESFSKSFCINKFHDLNVIPVLYVDYINECWDKYNNRQNEEIEEDEYDYVIVKLDKIKKAGKFKHNYCLFDLWWEFSFQILILVLARVDESIFDDFKTFKSNINELIDTYMEEKKYIYENYEEKCGKNEQNKIFNSEDKFIHVKYIVGIC